MSRKDELDEQVALRRMRRTRIDPDVMRNLAIALTVVFIIVIALIVAFTILERAECMRHWFPVM